jgi:hypothetical protein
MRKAGTEESRNRPRHGKLQAHFGFAFAPKIDPDKAGGQHPESSKRESKITIKKMIRSKRKIKRMIRFAPGTAAIERSRA